MALMMGGAPIAADEAWRIGLVNRVVAAADLMSEVRQLAQALARNGPLALQAVKRTVLAASGRPLEAAYRLEDEARQVVLASADAREGPRAFIERRDPVYRGK